MKDTVDWQKRMTDLIIIKKKRLAELPVGARCFLYASNDLKNDKKNWF